MTTDSAVVGGGGGGRVSFTTNSSLGNETCLPADVPPPKIAQPRDHEASVVVWTDLSLHDVDELLQASEVNAVALQEKIAEFFDLKGLGIFVFFLFRCSLVFVVVFCFDCFRYCLFLVFIYVFIVAIDLIQMRVAVDEDVACCFLFVFVLFLLLLILSIERSC